MTPYYSDQWLDIYQGDVRAVLPALPSDSVDCIVTSPPYWGLRDYGNDGQLGLERTPEEYVANMVAVFRELRRVLKPSGTCWLNLGSSYLSHDSGGYREGEHLNPGGRQAAKGSGRNRAGTFFAGASGRSRSRQPERAPAYDSDGTAPAGSRALGSAYSDLCDGCRADLSIRHPRNAGTHGQPSDASLPEPTGRDSEPRDSEPDAPTASPLDVRESTTPQSEQPPPGECSHCDNCGACLSVLRSVGRDARLCVRRSAYNGGIAQPEPTSADRTGDKEPSGVAWGHYTSTLKPKDMVPIPWLVAMALQADGWYLRSDIIWAKPNPMPESVTDRPTKSHEYLFLLTKSARYYFDADAVREADSGQDHRRAQLDGQPSLAPPGQSPHRGIRTVEGRNGTGRNLRSVWTIATRPYPGAHFAVFPPELPERCIKAGSSERGVCPECGAPWERVVERGKVLSTGGSANGARANNMATVSPLGQDPERSAYNTGAFVEREHVTLGWLPTCSHVSPLISDVPGEMAPLVPRPAVVLDPFAGSGTTGMVANRLSRRAILIDLNGDYLKQQLQRNAQTPLGLGAA